MPVYLIDTMKPKNGGTFPIANAVDIAVTDDMRLPEALESKANAADLAETAAEVSLKASQADLDATNASIAGKANAVDVSTATANLQSQIDELITPVTQDAEVQNARVDESGASFTTLKARLDKHDANTSNIQNELRSAFTLYDEHYVNAETGAYSSSGAYFVTGYIPCAFDIVVKTKVNNDVGGICFYTASKQFISGYNPYSENETEVTLQPPENAAYVRITCLMTYKRSFVCRYNDVLSPISENLLSLNSNVANAVSSIDGGYIDISTTWKNNTYVNNVQHREQTSDGFRTSALITLRKGESIKIENAYSATKDVVDLLSLWADDTHYSQSIKAYDEKTIALYEYTATRDIELVKVCTSTTSSISLKRYTDGLISDSYTLKDDVLELQSTSLTLDISDADVTEVTGAFINMDGRVVANVNYSYTESYELNAGETVSVTSADPSSSNVSRISLWTSTGQYIRTVALGTTSVTTAKYTAKSAKEYVRFSYKTGSYIQIKHIKNIIPDAFENAVTSIISSDFPEETDISYSISMFESVAFCGDSYVKGQLYDGDGLIGDRPRLAWGSCLGRMSGVDSYIYASSGADTETWQSRSSCLPLALSDDPRGLYIFCLGINDSSYVTTGTIDDITDYESYEDYPDTFYGNYGKIIEQIMEHAPNSKIIIMSPYHPDYNEQYLEPIQEITEHYGIAMINTAESALCMNPAFKSLMVHGHPTAPQHSAMANDIEKLIRKCINDNYSYFASYSGV